MRIYKKDLINNELANFLYSKKNRVTIFFVAGISLLAYLPFLVLPLYAIDDYFLYQIRDVGSNLLGYNFYSTGRFIESFLADIFLLMNLQPLTRPVGPVLFIFALSFLSVVISNALEIEKFTNKVIFCLLIVLNPFLAELFHYSVVPIYSAFAVIFISIGYLYSEKYSSKKRGGSFYFGVSFLSYIASLAVYQIFYPIIFIFTTLLLLKNHFSDLSKNKFSHVLKTFYPYFCAFIAYTLLMKIIFKISPPTLAYQSTDLSVFISGLLSSHYWSMLWNNFSDYILKNNSFNSLNLNLLLIFSLFCSLCTYNYDNRVKILTNRNFLFDAIVFSFLFFLPLIACLGFSVFRPEVMSGRFLTGFGVFQAMLFAVTCCYLRNSRFSILKKESLCIGFGIILIFGSMSRLERVALDQYRLNSVDRSIATRVVSRLELLDGFRYNSKLILLGSPVLGSISSSQIGDYNVSSLKHFSRVFAINELTGYSFQNPNSQEIAIATEIVKNKKSWPSPESLVCEKDLLIVKFN